MHEQQGKVSITTSLLKSEYEKPVIPPDRKTFQERTNTRPCVTTSRRRGSRCPAVWVTLDDLHRSYSRGLRVIPVIAERQKA